MSDKTSKRIGTVAARTLADKRASKRERSLAGSALSQVEPATDRRNPSPPIVRTRRLGGRRYASLAVWFVVGRRAIGKRRVWEHVETIRTRRAATLHARWLRENVRGVWDRLEVVAGGADWELRA